MTSLGRVGIIVGARLKSARLPGKALLPLQGIPMLAFLLLRLRCSARAEDIVLATSSGREDDALERLARAEGVLVYRGELDDVVARYVGAASEYRLDTVVRVTGDCPFVDGAVVDRCLAAADNESFDLCTTKGRFPVGIDAEVYRSETMAAIHESGGLSESQREHLTLFYYDNANNYRIVGVDPRPEWLGSSRVYTVDTAADYDAAATLAGYFETPLFSIADLVAR